MTLWLAVTPDALELPLAVADSMSELAAVLNVGLSSVSHKYHDHANGKAVKWVDYKIIRLEVDT